MINGRIKRAVLAAGAGALMYPEIALATVETSLEAIQEKLIHTILPLAAIIGLVFAGFSFVSGSPNARTHLVLALIGAAVGFGAPSIVEFVRGLIH